MPGGAPLGSPKKKKKKKEPPPPPTTCKPGYELVDGKCKRKCKYGRGDDGFCNPKPKSAKKGPPKGKDKPPPKPKKQPKSDAEKIVDRVVTTAANNAARKVADKLTDSLSRGTLQADLIALGKGAAALALPLLRSITPAVFTGLAGAIVYLAHQAAKGQAAKDAEVAGLKAFNVVDSIHRKNPLTPDEHRALRAQYAAYFLNQTQTLRRLFR